MSGNRLRLVTALAAVVLLLVAAVAAWIAYESCSLPVADVPGAPAMGCGSTEYGLAAFSVGSLAAAAAAVWFGRRR